MKSLRIGIEAQRIFRNKKGGMDVVAIELIKNLAQIDTENQYFIFSKPGEEEPWALPENFSWVITKNFPYPFWEQVYLPFLVKKHNLDLLHCTSNTAPLFPFSKLILTLHDIIFLENLRFLKGSFYQRFGNLYRKYLVPLVIKKCSKIFTVSNTERKNILKHFGNLNPEKIKVVYNGINPDFFDDGLLQSAPVRSIYNLPANYGFLLGNTDPKKNLPNIFKALEILKTRYGLTVNLAVTNFTSENLGVLLKKHNLESIRPQLALTGYVQKEHLPALYKQAGFFLYPSLREGFGLPILEAQICETPVITSDCSCMPEIAGKGAVYCNPFDSESIAHAINEVVIGGELIVKIVKEGRQNVKKFSWRKMAEKVYENYILSIGD